MLPLMEVALTWSGFSTEKSRFTALVHFSVLGKDLDVVNFLYTEVMNLVCSEHLASRCK